MTIVDIGIAAFGTSRPIWCSNLIGMILSSAENADIKIGSIHAVSSAVPDWNKNNMILEGKGRAEKTDVNRVKITRDFLSGKADWLFQIDDDTTPPPDALARLLTAQRNFIAGVYFNPSKPHNPIAYLRDETSGLYEPLYGYPKGTLIQVDSVGMGCTLIHRSVFEKIYAEHRVFTRPDGSIFAIHESAIRDNPAVFNDGFTTTKAYIENGFYHVPVVEVEKDERPFPFYAMEYGRTEDHWFCELAANVGIRPWVDTTVTCGHLKLRSTDEKTYDEEALSWMNEK